jgi:hypothetical protein
VRTLVFVVAIGCGAFTASAACVDTSGLSGDARDAGGDAAEADAGPTDASADAPPVDADAASDGGLDAGSRYRTAVLADNPIAYFRMGDPAPADGGIGHLRDEITPTRGSIPGGSPIFGEPGALLADPDTAIRFQGTDWFDLGDNFGFPGTAAFTIELWIKPTSGTFGHAFTKQQRSPPKMGYAIWSQTGNITFERYVADTGLYAGTNNVAPVGTWSYVVALYDGAAISLYVNGELVAGPTADTRLLPAHTAPALIAIASPGNDSPLDGSLDEIAIYDRALPVAAIFSHYSAGR